MRLSDEDLLEITKYALKQGDESVSEQYEEVQSVRLRASFLVTLNALSATLFAQFIEVPISLDFLLAIALLFFVVCNALSLLVMIPSGRWRITKSAGSIIRDFVDADHDLDAWQIFGILAIKTDEDQLQNEGIVMRAHSLFWWAAIFFAASTVSWVAHSGLATSLAQKGIGGA